MTGGSEGTARARRTARLMETTDELPTEVGAELVLGRYRLGRRLGAGGFGTVYAATDERLQRPVAVKVIPPARRRRSERGAHARRWPPAGSTIPASSPSSTPARTRGRATWSPSSSTAARSTSSAPRACCRDRDVLRIGLALCGALEHAHGRGVVHRDVKPQNVIVPDAPRSAAGVAKLADFGVAHLAGDEPLTRTGDVVGTLAYMAPEQAAGKRVDERCDLYSLALVLYEALAGVNPVRAGSPAATARRVGTVAPAAASARARTCRTSCAPRSTARCARSPTSAGRSTSSPPSSPSRCPRSPTRAGRSRRTRSSAPSRSAAAARRRPRRRRRCWPGGLAAAALAWAGQPVLPALAAVAAVALLPAARLARHRGRADRRARGRAARRRRARRPRRSRPSRCCCAAAARAWSVPALAPLLGLVDARRRLSRARRPRARLARPAPRSARSAPGGRCWPRRCSTWPSCGGEQAVPPTADAALDDGIGPLLTSRRAALRGRCGRSPRSCCPGSCAAAGSPLDVVAASVWAAALGAATAAIAESIGAPEPRGLVAREPSLAGVLAVAIPHLRRARVVEP